MTEEVSVLHKLWSLAVGKPDYVKADWMALDNELARLRQERDKWKEQSFRPLGDNHHNARLCPYCNQT